MNQIVQDIILDSIREINEFRDEEDRIALSGDAVLMGDGGTLDSLGLTNLIVAIEERVENDLGKSIILFDEAIFDEGANPFETVSTLATLIEEKIQ